MNNGLSADEFDEQVLAELHEDLGDSFIGFVGQFIVTANSALDAIDDLLRRGDGVGAAAQAHLLLGTSGYLGALAMSNALDALQHTAPREQDRDDALRHAAEARREFVKIQDRLRSLR